MVCATNANVEQVEHAEHAEHAEQAEQVRLFRCPKCRRTYGDPMYHGPAGHAPHALCFDCWASEWGVMNILIYRGRDWRPSDAALFLLCQGFSHQEAGDILGVARATVFHWVRQVRQHPETAPDWLTDLAARRRAMRRPPLAKFRL